MTVPVPCPVKACQGKIKIPRDLSAGVYQCICHHTQLRLSWIHYLKGGRIPSLTEEPKE